MDEFEINLNRLRIFLKKTLHFGKFLNWNSLFESFLRSWGEDLKYLLILTCWWKLKTHRLEYSEELRPFSLEIHRKLFNRTFCIKLQSLAQIESCALSLVVFVMSFNEGAFNLCSALIKTNKISFPNLFCNLHCSFRVRFSREVKIMQFESFSDHRFEIACWVLCALSWRRWWSQYFVLFLLFSKETKYLGPEKLHDCTNSHHMEMILKRTKS